MKLKTILVFAVALTVLSLMSLESCYYDNEAYLYNSGVCNDSTFTYNGRVKSIVDQNCATSNCHSGPSPEAGIGLETYADVKNNVENGEFLCSINWNSGCVQMPRNANKLDACAINAITKWKENAYPEN